jgi:putative membrane protein
VTAAGGTISILLGAVLLRLSTTGTYERYVRVGMGTWLEIAGVLVLALGTATLVRALRRDPAPAPAHAHDHDDHDDHDDHEDGVGVGWLLLAPIAALLLVAPPTLGSFGVNRGAIVDVREGAPVFAPIPHGSSTVDMSLLEYGQRSFDHGGGSFNDASIRLTGFVAGGERGGFRLARYQIACCAADATPAVVRVVGTAGEKPDRDGWVTVTGSFHRPAGEFPVLTATSVVQIPAPEDPYE